MLLLVAWVDVRGVDGAAAPLLAHAARALPAVAARIPTMIVRRVKRVLFKTLKNDSLTSVYLAVDLTVVGPPSDRKHRTSSGFQPE